MYQLVVSPLCHAARVSEVPLLQPELSFCPLPPPLSLSLFQFGVSAQFQTHRVGTDQVPVS